MSSGHVCLKRGENVQLTCPIPTHIEDGNLNSRTDKLSANERYNLQAKLTVANTRS